MIGWANILPIKYKKWKDYCIGYDHAIDDSLRRLESVEAKGEICEPLSVFDIESILAKDIPCWNTDLLKISKAIHSAMLGKKEDGK